MLEDGMDVNLALGSARFGRVHFGVVGNGRICLGNPANALKAARLNPSTLANRYYRNSMAATGFPYPATAIADPSSCFLPEGNAVRCSCGVGSKEVEMWSKEVFFCCLSFLVLRSLARKYWVRYQDHQSPISRMRSSGAL